MRIERSTITALTLAVALAPGLARADDARPGFSGAVDPAALSALRAGDMTATTTQTVTGTSEGNTLSAGGGITGGDVNIAGDALSNARGVVNITANTGAAAVVQSTMSVTVILRN